MVSYFKRFIFAGFIFCLSSLNYAFAGKNAGFIGFDLGGSAGAILSLNNGSSNIGTGITAGLRGGYQAFFNPRNGMRFYLAYAASFNAPSYAANPNAQLIDLERFGITHRADLNFDYLADFVVQERYTMGMFIGASVGYLLVNVGSQYIGGITGGINLGVRATLNNRHQFEIGLRGVGIQYRATNEQNVFGFNVFVGVNYSLLLGVK